MERPYLKNQTKPFYLFVWILLVCLCTTSLFAQDRIKNAILQDLKNIKETQNFEKDTTYINLLNELAREYSAYNLDSLLILSNKTIDLSKDIKYRKGEAQGYLIKGGYYSDIGDQDQAIFFFIKANLAARSINDIKILLQSKSELATEYMYQEEYAKSLKEFLDGIEIAKQYKNESWLSTFYVNISVLYSMQKEYKQTILFLKKAMEINERSGDQKILAITLSNLAFTYIEIGNLESADSTINEAVKGFKELELDSWLTYTYEIKATIYLKKSDFSNALVWLKKSERLHENIDQKRYKIPLYLLLAQTYYGLENYELSENYGTNALEISKELNTLENRDEILEILYKVNKASENYNEALTYLEDLKAISDTINKNNNIKELRILKSNLEFEQEREQYILENEQKNVIQRSYIYISVLIILAFLIIIIILKKNNKTQNALNQKLIENAEALTKNEAHLREANDTKSKLFSIIAHDLKGPINSFKSLFDLFNKSELSSEDLMTFMPQISENIDSIAFTLNNLLTWGQSQMNGLSTKPNVTSMKNLVEENFRLLSKQAELKLITTVNTVDKRVITWCDVNQIDIVIRNLVSNALKFTRENGTITIGAKETPEYWEMFVKDDGVGISKDKLTSIFNADETTTSFGTRNEKGTGLGLKICKEMVQNNGGDIWVESDLNQGSTFFFTVPKPEKL